MPYVRDDSASPIRRHMSLSPPAEDSKPGPSKKPKLGVVDHQRRHVEKLFENPDREIQLPTGARERTLRAPQEMVKNVQGSSAGAGSGEFHVYKQARRREYERLRIMGDKQRALDEQSAFAARQAERDSATEAKTAKNRAKRLKRKGKKGGDGVDGVDGGGEGKRKLGGGGGAGILFRKPGEEGSDDEEEGGEESETGPAVELAIPIPAAPLSVEPVRVVEDTKVIIHDDE